jgi:hypothetical protein
MSPTFARTFRTCSASGDLRGSNIANKTDHMYQRRDPQELGQPNAAQLARCAG